jgi:hypothetical protein
LRATERRRDTPTGGPKPVTLLAALLLLPLACSFDRGDRWIYTPTAEGCAPGTFRCTDRLERCEASADGPVWNRLTNCESKGLVCAASLGACATCVPESKSCDDQTTLACREDGSGWEETGVCDESAGEACREGSCTLLCAIAVRERSNVGCEYWAADLDNADVGDTSNAAAQQYAIVVSNVQHDVTALVTIEQDDTAPGEANRPIEVARAEIPPRSLRTFKLGPREVDGSPPGTFNSGTHTALTRSAYRVRSTFPVVSYQFNPLSNEGVFSNDASLLKPREAVEPDSDEMVDAYVVLGWPQTIASTDDPRTNFSAANPVDLRAFLTLIGTRENTTVRVRPTTRILGAPGIPETSPGQELELTLSPFDVLNLETDDFNADFTGTVVSADGPIVAFTGSEASDAPYFDWLTQRSCCADHLEEQLDHVRTAGRTFVAAVTPNRTVALAAAGAAVGFAPQEDYFRVIAATEAGARLRTSLPTGAITAPRDLVGFGDFVDIVSDRAFTLESDQPVMMMSVSASQQAAGVADNLPGGDPSALVIPPVEQYRSTYVFLTPDKYAFDFVRITAPEDAVVVVDGVPLEDIPSCITEVAGSLAVPLSPPESWLVTTCELSSPIIDPTKAAPEDLLPGIQNDGVHLIESDRKIGVLVDGFDRFVSYAYAAGTELSFIVPR